MSAKLERERIEASKVGNYYDAEQLKAKVAELKGALEISERRELSKKHQCEMSCFESLYQIEYEE